MNRVERCPYCGEPLGNNPEGAVCSYCGKPVERTVDDSHDTYQLIETEDLLSKPLCQSQPYHPQKMQTLAGLLLASPGFIHLIFKIFLPAFFPHTYWEISDGLGWEQMTLLFSTIPNFAFLLGCCLLIYLSSNKAIRVVAIGLTCLQLFEMLSMGVLSIKTLFPEVVSHCIWIASGFCWVYFISLIICNSQLSDSNKGWISLRCVLAAVVILYQASFLWKTSFDQALEYGRLSNNDYHVNSYLYFLFIIVFQTLLFVCHWKIARCEAFCGKYDSEHKNDFSPLNKWMAMALIFPLVIGMTFYFYYMVQTR